jgi:hypothetical protein
MGMEVLFQGKLSAEQEMREVLEDLLYLPEGPVGVLRISAPGDNLNGRITLYQRRYIIGATIADSAECGYDAVRKLLAVQEGNFAFMETGEEPDKADNPMCLDLRELVPLLPNLPDTLPVKAEAREVLPESQVAVDGLRDAIEAVRFATAVKTDPAEPVCAQKMRQMKKGIR